MKEFNASALFTMCCSAKSVLCQCYKTFLLFYKNGCKRCTLNESIPLYSEPAVHLYFNNIFRCHCSVKIFLLLPIHPTYSVNKIIVTVHLTKSIVLLFKEKLQGCIPLFSGETI